MKRKILRGIAKTSKLVVIAVMVAILALNVLTMGSVDAIKRGGHIDSGFALAITGSGSMEPELEVNDVLLIMGLERFETNDIITYVSQEGALVTHRIVEVMDGGYITRGDANNIPDDEIPARRVLGKVIFVLPAVGGIIGGLLTPKGVIIAGGIILLVLLLRRMWRLRHEIDEKDTGSVSGS